MKKIVLIVFLTFCTLSCSEDSVQLNEATSAKSGASQSQWSDYIIELSVTENGTLWTYTISKNVSNAKDLSHFILALNNCGLESAVYENILWATVNGESTTLSQSEGSGTNCNPQAVTTNFIKFDNLPSSNVWVLEFKFDIGFQIEPSGTGWIKAGNSCNQGVVPAPGCPIEDICSFSQGYFFANGSTNNGSSVYWVDGLNIGGITYTQSQGNIIWNIDRGPGGDQTMNGFFQLGAVRLSGAESQVEAHATIIDTYFNGLDVFDTLTIFGNNNSFSYFSLPDVSNGINKQDVIEAAGAIGDFIDANHCEEIPISN